MGHRQSKWIARLQRSNITDTAMAMAGIALLGYGLAGCSAANAPDDRSAHPEPANGKILANSTPAPAAPCPANLYWGDTHVHTINSVDAR